MALLIVGLIYLAILFAVGRTAEGKGRAPFPWIVLALFLGVLTFIPLLAVGPSREKRLQETREEEAQRIAVQRGAIAPSVGQIRELAELRESGLLTKDEFETKKTELLERL